MFSFPGKCLAVNIISLSRRYFQRSAVIMNRLLDRVDPILMIWFPVILSPIFQRLWPTFLSLVNTFISREAASHSFSFICRGFTDFFHCPCVVIPPHVVPQPVTVCVRHPMYRLWLHGLYRLNGPCCLLSPERPLNLITHPLTLSLELLVGLLW